eukprot:10113139-Alexandrium_andersonii.AAC.1
MCIRDRPLAADPYLLPEDDQAQLGCISDWGHRPSGGMPFADAGAEVRKWHINRGSTPMPRVKD